MFVAIRDIRFAKGRFTLMGSVVLLITLLIVLLSGLTAGLAAESTSGIKKLPATHVVFGSPGREPAEKSFADSAVREEQLRAWSGAEGVRWASPLGITQTRLGTENGGAVPVTVFGVRPDGPLGPGQVGSGTLVIGHRLAERESLSVGDVLTTRAGSLRIAAVSEEAHYNHTPVVWTSLRTWSTLDASRANGPEAAPLATVLAVEATEEADLAAVDAGAGTVSATVGGSLTAIGSFSSENGSLLLMQGFLYAISALVVGAFLTVWTIQRTGDIAVLKALGGSTRYLLRDAMAQSLVVLIAGAVVGGAAGVGLGLPAARAVPFELTFSTTVLPVLAMIVLGMIGAALAVRRITSVDPLTALGAAR